MSILEWLRGKVTQLDSALRPDASGDASFGDTETVRRIVAKLDAMEPERARYVAAFAYVLGRVANADRDISDDETRVMERLVGEIGGLPNEQAVLAVAIAKNQNRLFGGTENYLVTRELAGLASREQVEQLLHCLFAVAVADDSISGAEENQIRQIARELRLGNDDFISARRAYNDKRDVVRAMREGQR